MSELLTTVSDPSMAQRRSTRRRLTAYLYVLPALLIVVGVVYFGVGYNVWVSTLDWNGIDPNPKPVGLGNFAKLAGDPIFWSALSHAGIFAVITIFVQMALGLAFALVFNGPVFGRGIYRAIIFIPVVLAPAAVSTAFRQFYAADGQVNAVLDAIGLGALKQMWVADPSIALYAIVGVNIFQWTGFSFILYQAAFAQVSPDQLEAAQIDGAGTWRTITHIIFPQLRATHLTLIMMGVIGSLQTFDIVYLITGGGPGRATEFLTTYIYKQVLTQFHVGFGAAMSIVMLVIALVLTAVQLRLYRLEQEA